MFRSAGSNSVPPPVPSIAMDWKFGSRRSVSRSMGFGEISKVRFKKVIWTRSCRAVALTKATSASAVFAHFSPAMLPERSTRK